MAAFEFRCKDCNNKFQVEKGGISNLNDIGNVFCPGCGKKWGAPEARIEWAQNFASITNNSRSSLARENAEASRYAEEQAAQARRENPLVTIAGPAGKPPLQVPKSALDMIEQKLSGVDPRDIPNE